MLRLRTNVIQKVEAARRTRVDTVAVVALATLICLCVPASAFATGETDGLNCPFETVSSPGFRAYLPQCRAYEMVTPVYQGGSSIDGGLGVENISPDGEQVLVESLAGFAGTESLEQTNGISGSQYKLSRTSTGWAAEALDPPASLFPRRAFVFASADLSRLLFEVVPPDGSQEFRPPAGYHGQYLAVRVGANDGSPHYTVLGPMLAPGHECEPCANGHLEAVVEGASGDLTHVFIVVRAYHKQLWPGDQTVEGSQSVYEYQLAEGAEPVLVGVRNGARLTGSPHVNDGAQLESECGTAFEGTSESGESVFFMALHVDGCEAAQPPVNQLYVRVAGSRTVDLSEPSHEECAACDTSMPQNATFQGASEDGSQVFFTTEQKLLPEAKGNSMYEYDLSAPEGERVSLLATHVATVAAISPDGSHVYFTSAADLASEPNANGEFASEVPGEKLYLRATREATEQPAFVAGEPDAAERSGAYEPETTSDGEFLVFASSRDLRGTNDTSTAPELFEYDASTDAIQRVSVGEKAAGEVWCGETQSFDAGYNCDGNISSEGDEPTLAPAPYSKQNGDAGFIGNITAPAEATQRKSVAENGTVVFRSPLALTQDSVSGREYEPNKSTENVYEYYNGQVYLISPADEVAPLGPAVNPRLDGIDESGEDVFFFTTDSLVPQDSDTEGSVYDARRDGGFPGLSVAAGCGAEACQGAVAQAPTFTAPLSASDVGAGDLAPALQSAGAGEPKARSAAQVRAEKLGIALKACRKAARQRRGRCEHRARAKYGVERAKHASRRAKR